MKKILIASALLALCAAAHADEGQYKVCVASTQFTVIVAEMRDKGTPLSTVQQYVTTGNDMSERQRQLLLKSANDIYLGPLAKITAEEMRKFALDAIKNRCALMRTMP